MKVSNIKIGKIKPYDKNAKLHPKDQIKKVANSIKEFGFNQPLVIDKDYNLVVGHGRLEAAKMLGLTEIPVFVAENLTKEQINAYRLADNKLNESDWDMELVIEELHNLDNMNFDISLTGFDIDLLVSPEGKDDVIPEVSEEESRVKIGDVFKLRDHRLMCGDSTNVDHVELLMNGELADLAHNDPPYGMKKEKDGVLNDNLSFDELLIFNKLWVELQWAYLKPNASFYCWGISEPLMDLYSSVFKPKIRKNKATFKNIITWNKGSAQGRLNSNFSKYPMSSELCLFVTKGVNDKANNALRYCGKFDGIRLYINSELDKLKLTKKEIGKILKVSDRSVSHWTCISQWELMPKKRYEQIKEYGVSVGIEIFKKEYTELLEEKKELSSYFDNMHDSMSNVWMFSTAGQSERLLVGKHATPKLLELCSRVIKTSCPKGGIVVDFFGGSGSTLISAEKEGRRCYVMELNPKYIDVIIKRWEDFTGEKAIKLK